MQNQVKTPTEARKKIIASLTRPMLHFAPKAATQKAATQIDAEQKAAAEEEQAEAIANAKVGDQMPDGSIYAGISPNTKQPMCVTAKDASTSMDFNQAAVYAKDLDAHGHNDWRVPSKEELNLLFQNREKGALKRTFNLTGSHPSGWYWSSTPFYAGLAWCQQFSGGFQGNHDRDDFSAVRCVRC